MPEKKSASRPPLSCRLCRLGHFTIYGATIASTPDAANMRRREVRTLPAQRTFIHENEPQTTVHTLYSGWAFRFVTLRNGRRQILSFHIPGDTLLLESLSFPGIMLPFAVRSLTPVTLCTFEAVAAAEMMRSSQIQRDQVVASLQSFIASQNRHLADIGKRSALGRISQLLIEIQTRLHRRQLSMDGAFDFPLRQEHLADALGLTTVYVNRTLDRLRRENIIAFGHRRMQILDPGRLAEIAEEE